MDIVKTNKFEMSYIEFKNQISDSLRVSHISSSA